jgi:DNA recombination protein RmuC
MDVTGILLLLLGLAVGCSLGMLLAQSRGTGAAAMAARDDRLLELADSRFREAGTRATGELDQRRVAVEHLVAPLADTLSRVQDNLREMERARVGAYASLTEQVGFARESSELLRSQTASLVTALRAPQARGRWGEMQLRRVVEVAGMVKRCDFDEQASVVTDGGVQRPDMVVRLAGGRQIVVDAKVSLAAYLEAAESDDNDIRAARTAAHARHLRTHVEQLAAKEYWRAFAPTPELVVLFVPGEAFLAPALEHDPALLEDAMRRRVVIATPTTLVAMLRTIAYAWQQETVTEHAQEVLALGTELHRRISALGGNIDKLGAALRRSVEAYNATVGSVERSVLPSARRLGDLAAGGSDLADMRPVDEALRPLTSPELVASAERTRAVHAVPDSAAR